MSKKLKGSPEAPSKPAPYTYLENTPLDKTRYAVLPSVESRLLAAGIVVEPPPEPDALPGEPEASPVVVAAPVDEPREPARHKIPRPLISATALHELPAASVRIIDLRWYLQGKRGADEYANGHLPGAVFLDLEHTLTAPAGPGRHPIPGPEQFAKAMAGAGVTAKTHIVVYDDASGSIAARLWWLCQLYGHKRVSVLDGGLQAWVSAGFALSTEAPSVAPDEYVVKQPRTKRLVVDKWEVDARRGKRRHLLLDARIPARYRGEIEPVDARPGHIPGARNAPFTDNLEDGRFKDAEALRAQYKTLGVKKKTKVTVYCGSGVTACHDLLALALAFPEKTPSLYEGSWSDWAKDADRPADLGEPLR